MVCPSSMWLPQARKRQASLYHIGTVNTVLGPTSGVQSQRGDRSTLSTDVVEPRRGPECQKEGHFFARPRRTLKRRFLGISSSPRFSEISLFTPHRHTHPKCAHSHSATSSIDARGTHARHILSQTTRRYSIVELEAITHHGSWDRAAPGVVRWDRSNTPPVSKPNVHTCPTSPLAVPEPW